MNRLETEKKQNRKTTSRNSVAIGKKLRWQVEIKDSNSLLHSSIKDNNCCGICYCDKKFLCCKMVLKHKENSFGIKREKSRRKRKKGWSVESWDVEKLLARWLDYNVNANQHKIQHRRTFCNCFLSQKLLNLSLSLYHSPSCHLHSSFT